MILEKIHTRADLLALTDAEQAQLCREIRDFLVRHVSQTGGHLASNLGVVELTLAIERVFDTKKDRLVFDVGHQSYVHKLLTGRADGFGRLRKLGGLSGFPDPSESIADAFIAGHASNAVSVALGMARARTLEKQDYSVIALVGDGALTGGLSYAGLDNAGASWEPLIVILNDNGMSITPNVGAISRHLAKVRLRPDYLGFKLRYRAFTAKIPGGQKLYQFTHKLKERFRRQLLGTNLFDSLGFTYLGTVDGHDIQKVEALLKTAKALHEPVLLHLITKKGRATSWRKKCRRPITALESSTRTRDKQRPSALLFRRFRPDAHGARLGESEGLRHYCRHARRNGTEKLLGGLPRPVLRCRHRRGARALDGLRHGKAGTYPGGRDLFDVFAACV